MCVRSPEGVSCRINMARSGRWWASVTRLLTNPSPGPSPQRRGGARQTTLPSPLRGGAGGGVFNGLLPVCGLLDFVGANIVSDRSSEKAPHPWPRLLFTQTDRDLDNLPGGG